ncbi:hypothetical protein CANCADRAFT_25826 [Tortispora caseinolytica NRRL Y-17796]|uniref:GOLD domain-containing protein n=1 Tax=Tortispora caseinolytica NRRL Y-17796 TaxID=767744 RepID=A0A1E4THK4_9ASCO|nr:hypothetical protein CANCADRAFT_25826 [Tortispora caseinolytica NRRL Y-17796]
MNFFALALIGLAAIVNGLVYKVPANDDACFYTQVERASSKVSFYFAVQKGGSFDIDYSVTDPLGNVLYDGTKERQADFVFTASTPGEYKFCFANQMSTVSEKIVEFEITVEDEAKAGIPYRTSYDEHNSMEGMIESISTKLGSITRLQKYFKTRESRNFATVKSTETRIFWFSISEVFVMISMGLAQVYIVQHFFKGSRKTAV